MPATLYRQARRPAALATAVAMFAVLVGGSAATADAGGPLLHTTNLPTSEAGVMLSWAPIRSGAMTVTTAVSDTATRRLQVWRSWSCPGGAGTARLATTLLVGGSATLRKVSTAVRAIQTSCPRPQPAPQVLLRVTRDGSSAGVDVPVTVGSRGSWSNTADPFGAYTSATYDGETCQRTSASTWTVSDSFTVTGGTYLLLDVSTTGNGDPDLTPQLTGTPIGYAGGPAAVTFTIHNVYPFDPSGLGVGYRICPNQDEAYVDVDFAFPDGTYAGEWELTHAWPTAIPSCS